MSNTQNLEENVSTLTLQNHYLIVSENQDFYNEIIKTLPTKDKFSFASNILDAIELYNKEIVDIVIIEDSFSQEDIQKLIEETNKKGTPTIFVKKPIEKDIYLKELVEAQNTIEIKQYYHEIQEKFVDFYTNHIRKDGLSTVIEYINTFDSNELDANHRQRELMDYAETLYDSSPQTVIHIKNTVMNTTTFLEGIEQIFLYQYNQILDYENEKMKRLKDSKNKRETIKELEIEYSKKVEILENNMKILYNIDTPLFNTLKNDTEYRDNSKKMLEPLCCQNEYHSKLQQERWRMMLGSFFHDIGKNFIPLYILDSPISFKPKENKEHARMLSIMNNHTYFGELFFEKYGNPKNSNYDIILKMIGEHHNIKDLNKMTFYSKVSQLSDLFDALLNVRNYKAAMTFEQAFNIIINPRKNDEYFSLIFDQLQENIEVIKDLYIKNFTTHKEYYQEVLLLNHNENEELNNKKDCMKSIENISKNFVGYKNTPQALKDEAQFILDNIPTIFKYGNTIDTSNLIEYKKIFGDNFLEQFKNDLSGTLMELEYLKRKEPKQAFYKFSCVKDGFYSTFFEALSKKDKEESLYTLNELNDFITSHLRQKGVLKEGEVAKLENCYQPITKDGIISKIEVLSEITIYDKFGKNVVGRENVDENKKFQTEKGNLKGEVLTLLSTFANGKLSYDNKGEVIKDAYYYINEIANIYNVDRELLQAQNIAFSNELFKNNIESAMKHHKYIENCDWEKIKGINNIKGVSDTMYYTVNFGSNEINEEILKFLNRNKPFTKKYVHIELLEYANILDKPLNELSTKEEFEQLEKLKQIADKVKSLGLKVLCDDFQGNMYQKLENMKKIFEDSFSTIKVDAAISKKIMVYTSLQKLMEETNNLTNNLTTKKIETLLANYQFMRFLKEENNISIEDSKDFYDKLPELRKLANDGVFEFVKVNYYNTFNINEEQYKDFVNSSNSVDSELVDANNIYSQFKSFGKEIKEQNQIREITVEFVDTKDVSEFNKAFISHINKIISEDDIQRKVEYLEQGYLNASNISFNTIKNHSKPKIEPQSHNLEDV